MKKGAIIGVLALVAALFSCEDDVNRYEKYVTYDRFVASEYFNFRTSTEVTLNLNYGEAKMKMPISVYTSDPSVVSETTGEIDSLNAKLEPVFRGFTENDGTLSIKISVPSEYSKIYVANQVINHYSVSEVPIKGVTATLDLSASQETRLNMGTRVVQEGYVYGVKGKAGSAENPYNLSDKLGKWNYYGLTEGIYVDENAVERDSAFQNRVIKTLSPSGPSGFSTVNNRTRAKGAYYTNITTQQPIVTNERTGKQSGGTEVVLHFLYEYAGFHSVLGYYYYNVKDSDRINDPKDTYFDSIPKYIAMPNCTWDEYKYAGNSNGDNREDNGRPLQRGSSVKLKYYGEDYSDEVGSYTFPNDIEIGWFVVSDAFAAYDYTRSGASFTQGDINGCLTSSKIGGDGSGQPHKTSKTRAVWFPENTKKMNNMPYIFSNETHNKKYNGEYACGFVAFYDQVSGFLALGCEDGDQNSFADVIFYVQATPNPVDKGWEKDSLIVVPDPSYDPVAFTKRGVLAFEDLWPSQGDYDMNDVVLDYESTIYVNEDNNVIKIVDKFTPREHTATYTDAFGYELGIPPIYITSIDVDRGRLSASYFQTNEKGIEAGQDSLSVIMLYNSHREAVNQGTPITVTIEVDESKKFKYGHMTHLPPYNPFIVAQANLNAGEGRKEVHLPKDYRPTLLAGELLSKDDKSVEGCWYVANPDNDGSQYPFAITIPYSDDFKSFEVPGEGVKISEKYPKFIDWSRSRGGSNADWYRHPNN